MQKYLGKYIYISDLRIEFLRTSIMVIGINLTFSTISFVVKMRNIAIILWLGKRRRMGQERKKGEFMAEEHTIDARW